MTGSKSGVWLTAKKLQPEFGKMDLFTVFTEKYLRPYGCNDNNSTDKIKSTDLKAKIAH